MKKQDTTNILKVIKEATKSQHEKIEQNPCMKALVDNTIDLKNYYTLLYKFYGFHKAAEKKLLITHLWQDYNFDIEKRKKTPLLGKDLLYLGYQDSLDKILLCNNIPTLENDAACLGFLYVIEGSTLGGQILSRHLKQKFNFSKEQGASYFNSYGKEHLRNMWLEFQALLENYVTTHQAQTHTIVNTAIETFEKLDIWLENS